jgi:23S rRNA (pseudouridine1915-N3)-methyltransferase
VSRALYVLWAGRHLRPEWEALCADYRKRLTREHEVRDQLIKARCAPEDPARRRLETQALLAAAPPQAYTIALDPRGRTLSSEELAAELERLVVEWQHPIAFLIGSDLGLDPELAAGARATWSFGRMVFGHELARLVLYEQLYRALSQRRGIKYHRAAI